MRTSKEYILGFVGCGRMGMAIARGAVQKEYIERYQTIVYDHKEENNRLAKAERFALAQNEAEVSDKAHIVVLAVGPKQADAALEKLKERKPKCLLSIVTGLSIQHIQEILGEDVMVIRAMPNTPLQISRGSTALCKSENCRADEYDFVFQMFQDMGVARTVKEEQMNVMVSVHGSVPAYVYYFIDCMVKDAVERGLDEDGARALIVQTFIGAGELLKVNATQPIDAFINEVCTEGGTTIEAIKELKAQKLEEIIHAANGKCIQRADELSL